MESAVSEPGRAEEIAKFFQHGNFRSAAEALERLREQVDRFVDYHATVGLLGKTGVGKSALCNALVGREVVPGREMEDGSGMPREIMLAIRHGKGISLIDVPGFGGIEGRNRKDSAWYRRLLPEFDLLLWLIKADDRALEIDLRYYRQLLRSIDRACPTALVINQVDKIEPCREWDWKRQHPGPQQARQIEARLGDISRAFAIRREALSVVSAEEGFGLIGLVRKIVTLLPYEKPG